MKLVKMTFRGIDYIQRDGGSADYVKDHELGLISVNGEYIEWIKDGRKKEEKGFLRWTASEEEVEELEKVI